MATPATAATPSNTRVPLLFPAGPTAGAEFNSLDLPLDPPLLELLPPLLLELLLELALLLLESPPEVADTSGLLGLGFGCALGGCTVTDSFGSSLSVLKR